MYTSVLGEVIHTIIQRINGKHKLLCAFVVKKSSAEPSKNVIREKGSVEAGQQHWIEIIIVSCSLCINSQLSGFYYFLCSTDMVLMLAGLCISPLTLNCSVFWIYRYGFIAAAFVISKKKESTERRSHPMAETLCPCVLVNAAELFPHSIQSGGKRPQHQYFIGFNTIFPTFKINPWRGIVWIKNCFPLLHLNTFEVFLIKAVQPVCWTAFHTCWTYKSAQAGKWKWWFLSGLGQNWEMGWKERPKGKSWQFPGLVPVLQTARKSL